MMKEPRFRAKLGAKKKFASYVLANEKSLRGILLSVCNGHSLG